MNDLLFTLFDTLIGIILLGIGWFLKSIVGDIKDIEARFEHLPNVYARRDDMKEGIADIKMTLTRIEDKLDNKQDRAKQ